MFQNVLSKLSELPKVDMSEDSFNFYYSNAIEQVIEAIQRFPKNPFTIDPSVSPKEMAQGIVSTIDAGLIHLNNSNSWIPDKLFIFGVIAYIGIRPMAWHSTKSVLLELLQSPSPEIRSAVLLVMLYRGENDININIEDLRWSIERNLFYAYPLQIFGTILENLGKVIHRYPDVLDLLLDKHTKEHPYNCGGEKYSQYKALEMMLFLVENGRANRELLNLLMWRNEVMDLDPVELVYVERTRKLLAKIMQVESPIRKMIIEKIIQECNAHETPGAEIEGWTKMLMQIDLEKSDSKVLDHIIKIIHEVDRHHDVYFIKVMVSFARKGGNPEARYWLLEEISCLKSKNIDPNYAGSLLQSLRGIIPTDVEIEHAVVDVSKHAKNRSVKEFALKILEWSLEDD